MARRIVPTLAATLAVLGLAQIAASAAPPLATSAVSGPWDERDTHLHFAVRQGATPDQLIVTTPKDLPFPGGHDFVLARTAPSTFTSREEPNRPRLKLSFKSPAEGRLEIAGAGKGAGPHGGAWIALNDFILKRP